MIPTKANTIGELSAIFRNPPALKRPTRANLSNIKLATGIYALYATPELTSLTGIPLPASQKDKWYLEDKILLYIGHCFKRRAGGGMCDRLRYETAKKGYVRRDSKPGQGPAAERLGTVLTNALDLSLRPYGENHLKFHPLEKLANWFDTQTWFHCQSVDTSSRSEIRIIESALILQLCPILNSHSENQDFYQAINLQLDVLRAIHTT